MDDKPKATPKDFFLWAGATIALYGSVIAFITLLFSYLNYVYPDQLGYYTSDPYQAGVSYEMASLIVLGIMYSILSRLIVRSEEKDPSRREVWVRRWAIYLTLFAMAAAITVDLITLLMYFFNGDTPLRFILKVAIVLLVAGGVFLHHLADLHTYWVREAPKAKLVRIVCALLVVVTIVAGFFIIGTPGQARLYRFDEQRVNDLQSIQYQVVNYYQAHQKMPAAIDDLNDPLSGFIAPSDPQTGAAYQYTTKGSTSFELCATFSAEARPGAGDGRTVPKMYPVAADATPDTWQHGAGHTCYERTIDPAKYPPLTQPVSKP